METTLHQEPTAGCQLNAKERLVSVRHGDVYIATDSQIPIRKFAMKSDRRMEDQTMKRRFRIPHTSTLEDPCPKWFPRPYSWRRAHSEQMLIMDMMQISLIALRMGTLRVTSQPLHMHDILMIARQAFDFLEILHSKGFIHGNIKPEHFMLGPSLNPRTEVLGLTDFEKASEF